jgi:hypothetical protein
MKGQSFVDTFCRALKAKYENNGSLNVEKIGAEYSRVLLGETLLGERVLSEKFVGIYSPYSELQGFHYTTTSGHLMIVFDKSDTRWEQLRTRLHELGEYILSRLSAIWPDYGEALSHLEKVEGDAVPDRFTRGVLAKLVPTHLEVTRRMLIMRLGFNLTNMFITAWIQLMGCFSPRSSGYVSRELVEMPTCFDNALIVSYRRLTDYILLQERENSLSAEEIQGEDCHVCRSIFEKAI